MAVIRSGGNEIWCEVCETLAATSSSGVGEPVINRADICVNLTGERGEASRLSALRPELASLPKMRLCHTHLSQQRRKDGGEWVTITDASAMLARRDKKEMESAPPLVQSGDGTGSRLVNKLMENLGGGGSDSSSPYLILRKQIKK
ncbi:MAG: hypothetical protein WC851_02635 [Candidatus Shapirobacteria bacterium]